MSSSLRATTANWAFPSLSLFSLDRILIGQFAHLLSLYAIFNFVNWPFSKPQWVSIWASLYSYFEKGCGKKMCAGQSPKGNMGYDEYTVPGTVTCRAYFCCFPLVLANIRPWPLVPFFQISLKKKEVKITHNTFRNWRVHVFRPFSQWLYKEQVIFLCRWIDNSLRRSWLWWNHDITKGQGADKLLCLL